MATNDFPLFLYHSRSLSPSLSSPFLNPFKNLNQFQFLTTCAFHSTQKETIHFVAIPQRNILKCFGDKWKVSHTKNQNLNLVWHGPYYDHENEVCWWLWFKCKCRYGKQKETENGMCYDDTVIKKKEDVWQLPLTHWYK